MPARIAYKPNGIVAQFLAYAGIGAIGTIGHYTVLIALVQLWSVAPVTASSLGFIIGALINYLLNYHYTFQSNKRHSEALLKFLVVAAAGTGINGCIMYTGVVLTGLHYLVVQVVATLVVLLWNFTVNKWWTFAHTTSKQS